MPCKMELDSLKIFSSNISKMSASVLPGYPNTRFRVFGDLGKTRSASF